MGYQKARKNKNQDIQELPKELPIGHLPQTFNKIRENAREGCIFLSMAYKHKMFKQDNQQAHTHLLIAPIWLVLRLRGVPVVNFSSFSSPILSLKLD